MLWKGGNMSVKHKKELVINILFLISACLVIGNLLVGIEGFLAKGGENADDFTMRYRESRYLAGGVNPFDVVFGHKKATSIGDLWDVAGYTPWGMVYGILINFIFLPEKYARICFFALFLCLMSGTACFLYRMVARSHSQKSGILFVLLAFSISGWGTGLSWLNFGALFGVMIFLAVTLIEDHPVCSGLLFGLAAAKPQLALPFYMGLIIKKKYKTLLPAIVLPLFAWIAAAILTGTSMLQLLLQNMEVMKIVSGQLGNWISSLTIYFDLDAANGNIQITGAICCIVLAVYIWRCMLKNHMEDNLDFFSVAAILSGMWTYSQAHDRTVLIVALAAIWKKHGEWWMVFFCLSVILDSSNAARLLSYCIPAGAAPSLVFDFIKYAIWAGSLFYFIQPAGQSRLENMQKREIGENEEKDHTYF